MLIWFHLFIISLFLSVFLLSLLPLSYFSYQWNYFPNILHSFTTFSSLQFSYFLSQRQKKIFISHPTLHQSNHFFCFGDEWIHWISLEIHFLFSMRILFLLLSIPFYLFFISSFHNIVHFHYLLFTIFSYFYSFLFLFHSTDMSCLFFLHSPPSLPFF